MRIGKEAYWKIKRLVFDWIFDRIDGIDFCEVTRECVLEMEAIGF
jgi:hypothetical protein